MSARVAAALAMLALASPGVVAAQGACADGLARSTAATRAADLRTRLESEKSRLASWRTSWIAVFGAGTIGYVALARADDGDKRPSYYVGAAKSALGALSTPILSARMHVPEPVADPCADHVALQAALVIAARRQRKGVRWTQHLPGLALNLAGIAYLGLVHDLWAESLLGAGLGTLVGSLKVLTQPRRAPDWLPGEARTSVSWLEGLHLSASPRHFSLTVQF